MFRQASALALIAAFVCTMVGCMAEVPEEELDNDKSMAASEAAQPDQNATEGDFASAIIDEEDAINASVDYANCVGWYNGGIRCNALCTGLSEYNYTGWSYPKITWGECTNKAVNFCAVRGRGLVGQCWGT